MSFNLGDWLGIERDALPDSERGEFDGKTHQKLQGGDEKAKEVLLPREREWLDDLASNLNHGHLDGKSDDCDPHKKHVIEDSLEDVELSQLDLLGVDLVEYLHKHEGLEDVSEM